jgi:hypothetical protein
LSRALLSCGEELDDIFDGFVGAVIGGFEPALGSVLGIGTMVETGAPIKRTTVAAHGDVLSRDGRRSFDTAPDI